AVPPPTTITSLSPVRPITQLTAAKSSCSRRRQPMHVPDRAPYMADPSGPRRVAREPLKPAAAAAAVYRSIARSEYEARADGVRDERLAKASPHRLLGPPPGAVGRDDDTRSEGTKVVEDEGDERLEHRSVEVESAHHGVQRALFGQAAGVPAD